MPIYEYKCMNNGCGMLIEVMQKLSDDPIIYCPHCGEEKMKKIISQSNFVLKGGGWYKSTPQPKENTDK